VATATKTARTFQASTTNTAAGTTTGTGVNLTTALGCTITAKITNGATGPTLACSVEVQISNNGTDWKRFAISRAALGNNAVSEFVFDLPAPVMHARTVFTGNTGQDVTVEAFGHELTSVG
jgi:hypothetical protein